MGSPLYHVIPSNICEEQLFPLKMESYQLTFPVKNIIPDIGEILVSVSQNVLHEC